MPSRGGPRKYLLRETECGGPQTKVCLVAEGLRSLKDCVVLGKFIGKEPLRSGYPEL